MAIKIQKYIFSRQSQKQTPLGYSTLLCLTLIIQSQWNVKAKQDLLPHSSSSISNQGLNPLNALIFHFLIVANANTYYLVSILHFSFSILFSTQIRFLFHCSTMRVLVNNFVHFKHDFCFEGLFGFEAIYGLANSRHGVRGSYSQWVPWLGAV